jgi:hypothetical protein
LRPRVGQLAKKRKVINNDGVKKNDVNKGKERGKKAIKKSKESDNDEKNADVIAFH